MWSFAKVSVCRNPEIMARHHAPASVPLVAITPPPMNPIWYASSIWWEKSEKQARHRCVAVSQTTTTTTSTLQRQPCETNKAKDCCGTTSYNKTSKPTSINQFFRLIPPYRSSSNSFPCGSSSSCPTGRSKRRNQTAEPYQSGSNHRTCGTRGWAD